jgi:hypothetical protein
MLIFLFGSNCFLDSKKARGEALKPWSDLLSADFLIEMVEPRGVEPLTFSLRTSILLLVAAGL